jgi:hypothetical protein
MIRDLLGFGDYRHQPDYLRRLSQQCRIRSGAEKYRQPVLAEPRSGEKDASEAAAPVNAHAA